MASNLKMSNAAVNAEADALARLLDGGFIKIYTGTQPATADTALSGNTLLGTLGVNATSAPAASAGVLTFNAVFLGYDGRLDRDRDLLSGCQVRYHDGRDGRLGRDIGRGHEHQLDRDLGRRADRRHVLDAHGPEVSDG